MHSLHCLLLVSEPIYIWINHILENIQLKHELHNLKGKKSLRETELEDNIQILQEVEKDFSKKIIFLELEVKFLKQKLQNEIILREELIRDADKEKSSQNTQIKDLLDLQPQHKS